MPNQFTELARGAREKTEEELSTEITNLTSLTNKEVLDLITESGISKEDLAKVLEAVHDSALTNEKRATAIKSIGKGVEALVSIAEKVLKYV